MSSKARRSRLAKVDGNENASNSPKNVSRTRRSSQVSHPVQNTEQISHSKVLEEIFEEKNDVSEGKKKENTSNKKLKNNEILDTLYLSDEEMCTGKNWKSVVVSDENTIKMKFITQESKCDVVIGAKEKTKSNIKLHETSKKVRSTVGKLDSYNEDELMAKHVEDTLRIINSATPKRNNKNKLPTGKQVAGSSPRKRTNQISQQQEFQQYSVDENEMCHTNQISSPPKQPKSETDIQQTPKKNSHLEDKIATSRKNGVKRKIPVEQDKAESNSRMNTRRSTRNNYGGQYTEWSSSDDNTTKRLEPQVVLKKIVTKKTNKESSKSAQTSESGESEIENKMHIANKNSTPRTRSKSIRAPFENSEEPIYSPSKHIQKLNISEDMGTPTGSNKKRLILKLSKSFIQTPSSTKISNTEKQDNALRKSQRLSTKYYDIKNDSEDESADSSDNYSKKESESEEDSIESGDDSAEEFQELSKKRRNMGNQKKVPATPKTHKRVTQVSMDTPTKAISRMSIGTPTLDKHRRTTSIHKPSTPLQKARATLHVSVLPKSLPCREEQFNDIYSFLHARLSDGSGGCIYISGVPGTGKTATVSEVICCLKKSVTKGELSDFNYIDINGMKLSEPRQAYVQIWKQMTGETKTWEESHKLLQNKFVNSNSKRKMTLLLVDELDLLCTKRQDVVYNLLDWPSKANAKLVVVTIANTMDLPERILMGKVTSRLGLTRLTFPPYNFKQLEQIVLSRLKGANAFGGETIQLVARKVAAVSGDARRALDICRRSAEIAEKNGREQVSMMDVKEALDEMIASPKIQAIKHCSDMEKYFLQAVCTEVQRTGIEEVVFQNVYRQMETLCSLDGLKIPNISEALEMCARLGSWRLLLCDHSRMDIHQRLLLNVSTDDVYFATKEINA